MQENTTTKTIKYIKEHPYIQSCLKKGLINYSSLARTIAKELDISKKTSMEAILIAARRFKEKLKNSYEDENAIKKLLSKSEIEIKNKISVLTLKSLSAQQLHYLEEKLSNSNSTFFLLKGSEHYTLILQEKFVENFKRKPGAYLNEKHKLSMVLIKSSQNIEVTKGVVAYLTNLFFENGINIIEFSSSWTDTVFVISSEDVQKTIEFLNW